MYVKSMEEYNTIAIFSHEQFIRALLWLSQRDTINLCQETMREFRDFLSANSLVNGAIVRVQFDNSDEQWRYKIITSHLEELEEPRELEELEHPEILELIVSGSNTYK